MTPDYVSISIEYESGSSGTYEVEGVWAEPVADGYRIANIPLYAYDLAHNDVVAADPDEKGLLRYRDLVRPSGHSTLRLWFSEEAEPGISEVREKLHSMGCQSELGHLSRLIAVDVPPNVEYVQIRHYLEQLESTGVLGFEEACLGFPPGEGS